MATKAQLVSFFTNKAKQAEIKGDDLNTLVNDAIEMAIIEVWNERWWRFRMLKYNLEITDQSNEYALPETFAGVASIKTSDTNHPPLEILAIEEFDARYPVVSSSAQPPDACAIYSDEAAKANYIKFNRIPGNQTFPMIIFRTTPSQVDVFPDIALSVLKQRIWTNMLVIGSESYRSNENLYWLRVNELEGREGPIGGLIFEMPTGRPSMMPAARRRAPWM